MAVDSIAALAEQLRKLLTQISERLSELLVPSLIKTSVVEKPTVRTPQRLSSDWRTVERELAAFGIRYPLKAVEACRRRGDTIEDVRAILRRDGLTKRDVANRLIHGTQLPQRTATQKSANAADTVTELWEQFCAFCKSKSLNRASEFWRFEKTLTSKGLEIPPWLQLEGAAA